MPTELNAVTDDGCAPRVQWSDVLARNAPNLVDVMVAGRRLAAQMWPGDTGPDVLLVHGGAAQRHWWDHVAPLLTGVGSVIAVDLSGHGDSEWGAPYTLEAWSDDVIAVAEELAGSRPVLVGHSLGGLVSVGAAQRRPDGWRGVIALDSPLQRTDTAFLKRRERIATREPQRFKDHDEAIAAYRPYPLTVGVPTEVMHHIGSRAYRRTDDDAWVLKFDPAVYRRPVVRDQFVRGACVRTTWIRAEHGVIDEGMAERIAQRLGTNGRVVDVAGVGHNLLLEQPIATAWLVSSLISSYVAAEA